MLFFGEFLSKIVDSEKIELFGFSHLVVLDDVRHVFLLEFFIIDERGR